MSLNNIHNLIGSITKNIDDSYEIATPILSVKLAKCVKEYPYDQTIGAINLIIEKLASSNKIFIKRADLKDLYNKLYSRNTKFAELFKEELGLKEKEEKTIELKKEESYVNNYSASDPILLNALNCAFNNTPPKMYSQALANKAINSVNINLESFGLKPNLLTVNDGNENILVLKADYETPKGITSFYIPVETYDNKISEASVFIGNGEPKDLNYNNVKKYILSNAGSKLKIEASSILEVLTKASSTNKEISNVELALIKFNSSKKQNCYPFQNQILGQKIAETSVKDVELPRSKESFSYEKYFSTPNGIANFKFGDDKVKIANDVIYRELVSLGYINPKFTISDSNEDTIFYNVVLNGNNIAFTVPIKVSKNVNKPTVILCNGSMSLFNKDNIDKLSLSNKVDNKVIASVSSLFGLGPNELLENIRTAMSENNFDKAEDALNVLANLNNPKFYAIGFGIYMQGLNKKEDKCNCTMVIKNSTSKYPICGHTGLPIHKVYQDKYGNCLPLYRRGMEETYEPAIFMKAKILG